MDRNTLIEEINELLKISGTKKVDLAKMEGCSSSYIQGVLSGNRVATMDKLTKIKNNLKNKLKKSN
jgi:antitoxin component HigA of HigAB toxin-antitoxin module